MSSTASCEEMAARTSKLEEIRLRLVDTFDEPGALRAETAVREAETAVSGLRDVDVDALDAAELRAWLEGIEALRRMVESTAVAAAGRIDRSNPFRDQGFFSPKTVVKHLCALSGPEAIRDRARGR